MVHYMFDCQKINPAGLPYGSLIIKFMVEVGISLNRETSSKTHGQLNDESLSLIKVYADDENLEDVLIEADVKDNLDLPFEEKLVSMLAISQEIAQVNQRIRTYQEACFLGG